MLKLTFLSSITSKVPSIFRAENLFVGKLGSKPSPLSGKLEIKLHSRKYEAQKKFKQQPRNNGFFLIGRDKRKVHPNMYNINGQSKIISYQNSGII